MGWGWIYLIVAGLTEMGFNYFLELSKEFRPALIGFLICYALSGIFIYQAVLCPVFIDWERLCAVDRV